MMRSLLAACALAGVPAAVAHAGDDLGSLGRMSLEELSNLVVTSVSKDPESIATAPAAVYVITREDLLRSGATTLPDALRLAPNLQVAQHSANAYTVAPRGLAGNYAAQNFPNKLLVLIDGRSVYSPLFSGVYWDAQDVVLEDVDRIEVISGPGATLWGANAFNGVVNVITRSAADTAGVLASVGAGTLERTVQARWGGAIAEGAAARVYAKALERDALERPDGSAAEDDWSKVQAGFRADVNRADDTWTLQGDVQREWLNQPGPLDLEVRGANLLGRWQRAVSESSNLQAQFYVDESERAEDVGGFAFRLRTYDVQLQHTLSLGSRHRVVWGLGHRVSDYEIRNTAGLQFQPPERTLRLSNVFAQDTIAIGEQLKLSLGLKLEDDPYSGWTPLPDARLAWTPRADMLWWAAVSRAIRAATPFDVDVVEQVGGVTFLRGNPEFRPERVTAYELGYRGRPAASLTLSVSAFYNQYDDLRTIEPASATALRPFYWGNGIEGHAYGVDAWADWQVTPRWRLSPGYRWLRKRLEFSRDASGLLGVQQAGLDPREQAMLVSSLDLGAAVAFDLHLRYQGPIAEAGLDGYTELDVRLGWKASRTFDVALVGRNLLHDDVVEAPVPGAAIVGRCGLVTARWNF